MDKLEFLYLITLVYLIVIMPFAFLMFHEEQFQTQDPVDVDQYRNENSTPRSFVLPATTAVAYEQVKKHQNQLKREILQRCIWRLDQNGYTILDIEDITNHRVLTQTLEYQLDHNLNTTGLFDKETRELLRC